MPALLLPAASPAALRRTLVGERLRRCATRAALANPWSQTPFRAAKPWVTGEAVRAGSVRSNAGGLYVSLSATTTGANPPIHTTGVGSSSDGAVQWTYLGAVEITADAPGAPVVTGFGASEPPGYANKFSNDSLTLANEKVPGAFALRGGYRDPAVPDRAFTFDQKAGARSFSRTAWEFETDAPGLALQIANGNAGLFQIYVDDRRLNYEGLPMETGNTFYELKFASMASRRIRLVFNNGATSLKAVRVGGAYQVWAPADVDPVRAYVISDSIWAGAAFGPALVGGSPAQRIGDLLGWQDVWDASIGGTGYIAKGAGSDAYTFRERVVEGLTRNPDMWVLMGSTNDGGADKVALQAEALATYRAIRAGSAAPIIVLGLWPTNSNAAPTEAAIKAAVEQFADPLTSFVPVTADAVSGLPWVLANHNRSNMQQAGQGGIMFADGTHPADFGHAYLAKRINRAIRGQVLPRL